ncbi:MAG: hypothetical protein MI924_37300 [Chloroflexales bacterium]|nr:hypothetical protein [Chloroflexales bacterium]
MARSDRSPSHHDPAPAVVQSPVQADHQPTNPYKGLAPFDEADAASFFGRAMLVERMLERLAVGGDTARLLAVVGPSGSGKSSIVRAGLIPALRQGRLPGFDRWLIAPVVPAPGFPWRGRRRRAASRPSCRTCNDEGEGSPTGRN